MKKGTSKAEKKQESHELETRCWEFLKPFLEELHQYADRRLVKTLLDLVLVILMHRHRNNGLLLSELGDHLMGGDRGPAGVKRIASLLHSARWKSNLILKYLWERANERVKELVSSQAAVYVIWDESVLEKNESLKAEGLCAVRSSKVARLKHIKPGYFNPPTGPSHHCAWIQLAATSGDRFARCSCPGAPMLVDHARRKSQPKTAGRRQNPKKSGKRSWDYRMIWDARRRCQRKTGIIAAPIHLPNDQRPTLSGCFSPRIRAQALVPPHHRTNPHG